MTEIPENDEPLDPKVEAVRRKMTMLLALSGGIMLIGLMTVLIAIVYRLNRTEAPAPVSGAPVALSIPAKATLAATQTDATGVTLTLTLADGETEIRRFDAAGRMVARYRLTSDAPGN